MHLCQAFGKGEHYWHGEGYWSVTYEECSQITKSQQVRGSAFACIEACVPDLFATNLLLFLPTGGPESEWAAIRRVLHAAMLDRGAYQYSERLQKLSSQLALDWPKPQLTDFSDTPRLRLMVVKSVFFMIFGIWLDDQDAQILRGWRDGAVFFVLPRLIHRFVFNFLIRKVKQLRIDTVGVIEKLGLQQMFVDMNKNLPEKYRRPTDVKLCDEIMFAVGFAGVGGTSAACETIGAFLQRKIPEEASASLISFEKYPTVEDMVAAYKQNPVKYIKEACRIDPPVTSCTRVDPTERELKFLGIPYKMQANTLNQYVISMANRDTKIFENPSVFDPTRKELDMALTWNGAFGTANEETVYPRICPGRFLALDVVQAIVPPGSQSLAKVSMTG
ncbi:PRKAA1 [Symbiodinium pilosum]|uniref:PRKAA1 protein n=1 Tax=Symbiodinium pilosum TaxID=2952 RepID=A0A812XEH7_SYMPI|nr:PRKAA1 [Symbiodinium pilosum]